MLLSFFFSPVVCIAAVFSSSYAGERVFEESETVEVDQDAELPESDQVDATFEEEPFFRFWLSLSSLARCCCLSILRHLLFPTSPSIPPTLVTRSPFPRTHRSPLPRPLRIQARESSVFTPV